MEIGAWLRGLGLGQHEAAFRDNEIDAEVLPELTDQHFKDLGIPLGHRLKLLRAIRELGAAEPPAAKPEPKSPDAAERRQLTVLFCDLVGSTALSARLDPEDMRRVIRAYQDAVSGVVARYDGFVAKFMGDGVLAYFGFPRAHEDDAARAVHAGLELARVIAGLETPAREKLAARIGIATGLVVVGDIVGQGAAQEQAVVGDTPNLAARLQGLADAGGVVISAATRRLVGDGFRLKDLGRHVVKGLAEPVEPWTALGIAASESRFEAAHAARLTGFVGREAEAADLMSRQRRAWAGRGQIVLISGEAGIGKSRLSAWVAEQVAGLPHVKLRYQCSPYHRDSALYPFAQQFERAAGFAAQDGPEAKLDKLEKVLALATDRLGEVAPLIAAMLSLPVGSRYPALNLSPAQQRRQTLFALIDQMEGLANKQPILMLFEDAHWADATSLEVLDLAIERMRKLPVLLLITFRPEFEAPWRGLPDVAEISLARLEPAQAEALVAQVTGGRKLPAEVLAQIVAKTDGVPLFVEELTKNVLESGLLVEEADRYRLDGPLPPLAIPSTLQDSLMARLDRLAAVKEIAQIGAAIGREFSYALLREVVGRDEATLRTSLAQLEESELVFRAGEPPAARYTFKHALVQDTAYESLLKSRRQILHQRIAEALRDKFPERVEAEPELIAEHYTRAGLTEPAIVHWGKAGDLALRRSAFKEAIAHLGKAIEMTEAGAGTADTEKPGGKLKLQVALGNALMTVQGQGAPEARAAFERARVTASAVENAPERLVVSYGLYAGSYLRGELGPMREHAEALLQDVATQPDSPEAVVAHRAVGITAWCAGNFAGARRHLEQSLAIFNPNRDSDLAFSFGHDAGVAGMAYLALTLWPLGEVDRARQLVTDMMRRTIEITHVGTICFANMHAGYLDMMRGDSIQTNVFANAFARLARDHDLKMWTAFGVFLAGWTARQTGVRDAGLAAMRDGASQLAQQEVVVFDGLIKTKLAQAEADDGAIVAALAIIDDAIAVSERTGHHWYDAELHRIRGEILLKQTPTDPAPAEAAFFAAIAVAQSQKTRSFELRAALALAKLYQSTNRPIEAHDILGPALEGFSPRPEFPEIAEARALFEALATLDDVKAADARRSQRLKLQVAYGNAMLSTHGYGARETSAVFARAREIATGVGDVAERISAQYGLWIGSFIRGELAAMRELTAAMLSDRSRRPQSGETCVAHRLAGATHWYAGEFVPARDHLERAVAVFDAERDRDLAFRFGQDIGVSALTYSALALWPLGEIKLADERMKAMVARATQNGRAATAAYGHFHAAVFELVRRDTDGVEFSARSFLEVTNEQQMASWMAYADWFGGWLEWRNGNGDAGLVQMRAAIARLQASGDFLYISLLTAALAQAESTSGELETALATVDGAFDKIEKTGARYFEAEAHRLRGEILLKRDASNPGPVEAAFLAAIAVAQSQKARSFELRAALALAKLYQSTNRPIEAHDLLGPALAGFAPTPEFPEIAEATALFESLASDAAVKAAGAARKRRVDLHVAYSSALLKGRGMGAPETRAAFERARELAAGAAAISRPEITFGLWSTAQTRGELAAMRELADALQRQVKDSKQTYLNSVVHRVQGITKYYAGEFLAARVQLEQAVAASDPARDAELALGFAGHPGILARAYLAHTLWPLGEVDEARRAAEEATSRLERAEDLGSICLGRLNRAQFEMTRGDFQRAAPQGKALAEAVGENNSPQWEALVLSVDGWIRWHEGDRDAGRARMREGVAQLDQLPYVPFDGLFKGTLAGLEAEGGGFGAALSLIDSAIAVSNRTGFSYFDAELHRIRGEILLKRNPADPAPAEAAYLTAIAVAQSQKARSFELRAALALARLYQSTHRPIEAHDVLGPALEGFAPTPEFAGIGEAKGLLEALASDEAVKAAAARRAQRLKLHTDYGQAVMWSKGYAAEETKAAFARVGELATDVGNVEALFDAYHARCSHYMICGELEAAREAAESFLREAESKARLTEAGVAHRFLGLARLNQGDFAQAREHLEHALRIYDPERDREATFRLGGDAKATATSYLALAVWRLGEVGRARELMDEAVASAVESAHVPTLVNTYVHQALLEILSEDADAARRAGDACFTLSREHGLALYLAFGALYSAWARAKLGERGSGAAELRQALAGYASQGNKVYLPFYRGLLAKIEADAGDAGAALAEVDGALALAGETGEHWSDPALHRIRGEILLKQTPADPAQAEAAFLTALEVARAQKARSFELRGALALARLYQLTGRAVEAQAILGRALEGFSPTPEFAEIAAGLELLAAINQTGSRS